MCKSQTLLKCIVYWIGLPRRKKKKKRKNEMEEKKGEEEDNKIYVRTLVTGLTSTQYIWRVLKF